ncbi:hypothetical protein N9H68_06245 [Planktomarina temperata]|nr:hypothetical protein [Planktomarina temperata]
MSAYTRQKNAPGAYAISQATLNRTLEGKNIGDLILGARNDEIAAATEGLGDLGTAIFTNTEEEIVTIDVLVIDNTPDVEEEGTGTDGTGDTDDAGGTDTDGTGDTDDAGGNSSSSSEDEAANTCGPLTFDC